METALISDNLVLSLCIPTYNRLSFLKESLSAVINQINDKVAPFVEVVISDNASTDGTDEYVKKVMATYPHLQIRYFCSEENLGLDMNVYHVTNNAQGTWVYILSDDDIFLPGGVERLLSLIGKHPSFDAFCLNMCSFETDTYKGEKPFFNISEDLVINGKNDILSFLGQTGITYISTIVFRRDAFDDVNHLDKIGTLIRHSYIYLDTLSKENGLYITQQAFVAGRLNNSGGYNFFKVFILNFHQLMLYAENLGYSSMVTEKILTEHFWKFIPYFIVKSKLNRNDTKEIDSLNTKEIILLLFQVCSKSLFLIPASMATILLLVSPRSFLSFLISLRKLIKFN
jgi:abequosyltransferase